MGQQLARAGATAAAATPSRTVELSGLPEPFKCHVFPPQAHVVAPGAVDSSLGIILLSDIYGCDTHDTLAISQTFANELQCAVYVPDIFHAQPWPEDKPEQGNQDAYEQWRLNIGGAGTRSTLCTAP
jgi:hypothetical protein